MVNRSAIKKGMVPVGKKVAVTWGKSKKTYNAAVISVSVSVQTPVAPASMIEGLNWQLLPRRSLPLIAKLCNVSPKFSFATSLITL